ncbi:MAG: hypothetical protein K8823_838 [Cenarchaeum symbiont of Oopsacas minuta]|nr:hypothetical protein [Cenarchaeum symbiont of Oopsacas minuta]
MVLVLDPQIAGIAGDMLLCSLVDIGADIEKIKKCADIGADLAGTKIRNLEFVKVQKCGMSATKLLLDTDYKCNLHTGNKVAECINMTCNAIGLSQVACKFASNSVQTLIKAESYVHGQSAESVHFHEMAAFDTILDIIGTASALESLGLYDENIVTMPVNVGSGMMTFSHGTVSNPGPAVLEIFKNKDIQLVGSRSNFEMTTPTGACMLNNLVSKCLQFYPTMKIDSIGYGAGERDFEDFANVLKLVRGSTVISYERDSVTVLETCIDDVSGEILGHAIEKLMASGARDVTVSPATGKKGRPANNVTVICDTDSVLKFAGILMSETGTLGVRTRTEDRITAKRSEKSMQIIVKGREFEIRLKLNESEDTFKIEADDIRTVSRYTGESFGKTERMLRAIIGEKNAKL